MIATVSPVRSLLLRTVRKASEKTSRKFITVYLIPCYLLQQHRFSTIYQTLSLHIDAVLARPKLVRTDLEIVPGKQQVREGTE